MEQLHCTYTLLTSVEQDKVFQMKVKSDLTVLMGRLPQVNTGLFQIKHNFS